MAIILIIIIAFVLRIINLNQSLWLDEAISAIAARDFTYTGIIFDFLKIDNHPPLFYLLLRFWGQTFGFVDTNLRFLSVFIGVAVTPVVYRLSLNFSGNKKLALSAAFLTATSPLLVYYSQEVRMYMLITFLAVLEILIFSEILNKQTHWKWVLFSVVNCLLFFSDYITVFLFPVFVIYPIIFKKVELFKKVLLSFVPLFLLLLVWHPYLNEQLIKNKNLVDIFPNWKNVIGGATHKNLAVFWMKLVLGRISLEPKLLYYSSVAIFSIPFLAGLYSAFKERKNTMLLLLWFLVPVISGFSFSIIIPVFNYFRFIYVLPALLILTTIGVFRYETRLKYFLFGLLVLGNAAGLCIYYLDPSQHRENWRQAVDFIKKNGTEKDIVVFEFHEEFAPFRWYSSGKIDSLGATNSYFGSKEGTYEKLENKLQNKNGVYYFEYLRDLSDPNRFVEQKLSEDGFKKGEVYNFYSIGQITYWHR